MALEVLEQLQAILSVYSETFKKRTFWEQYKIKPFCSLLRGCPLLEFLVINTLSLSQRVL